MKKKFVLVCLVGVMQSGAMEMEVKQAHNVNKYPEYSLSEDSSDKTGLIPKNNLDYTASMFEALNHGNRSEFSLCLQEGADVNALDKNKDTPLMLAVILSTKDGEWVTDLLKKGAEINKSNVWGDTVLTIAVTEGNLSMVKLLLAHKADVNYQRERDGMTPLILVANKLVIGAACYDVTNWAIAFALMTKEGAKLDIQDKNGATALHKAIAKDNVSLAAILLEHGARFDIPNQYGLTVRRIVELAAEVEGPKQFRYQALLNLMNKRDNELSSETGSANSDTQD